MSIGDHHFYNRAFDGGSTMDTTTSRICFVVSDATYALIRSAILRKDTDGRYLSEDDPTVQHEPVVTPAP